MKNGLLGLLLLGAIVPAGCWAAGAIGTRGMAATDHELASEAAVAALRDGGNAMDAAIVAAYVLGVVNPQSSGLGGGGFLVYHDAAAGKQYALEYRDRAPRGTALMLAASSRQPARFGGEAAAVPSEVAGLEAARERFGTLPRQRLVQPAVRLARDGFPAGRLLATMAKSYLADEARTAELDRLVLRPDGSPIRAGDRIRQTELAGTLDAIGREGAAAMSAGPRALAIASAVTAEGGRMDVADLAAMRARWVEPLRRRYRGLDVVAMPPPASGAVALMALRLLEPTPMASLAAGSPAATAPFARAMAAAVAAKRQFLGDPLFSTIPLGHFLDGTPLALGDDAGEESDVEPEEGDTTNVSVIDRWGNAVAMTMSLGAVFGSHIRVGGTGVVLSNHVADFSPGRGRKNGYGVRYGDANVLAPGKAAVSGSTPMLFLRDRRVVLAIGGSGSARIPPAVTQCAVNILDHGMTPDAAVAAARFQVSAGSRSLSEYRLVGRSSEDRAGKAAGARRAEAYSLRYVEHVSPRERRMRGPQPAAAEAILQQAPSVKVWFEPSFSRLTQRALALQDFKVRRGVKRSSVTAVAVRDGRLLGGSDPRKFGVPMGY